MWHLTNRGVDRHDVFFSHADRNLFLEILASIVGRLAWIVHAWVEMTNHYHLLVQTPFANLSRGMKELDGEFAQTINHRHGRSGHLFQGRFDGRLVQQESHLLSAIRYVVLNPVRARMVRSAGEWPWSNYRATAGLEPAPPWLETNWTLQQFHRTDRAAAQELYREFVAAGAGETRSIWEDLRAGLYLGTEEFGAMLARLAQGRRAERAYPREHRWPWRPTLPALVAAFAEVAGTPLRIRSPHTIDARRLFAAIARDRCGAAVEQIAEQVGLSGSGATKLVAAGRALIRRGALADLHEAVESKLESSRPERK